MINRAPAAYWMPAFAGMTISTTCLGCLKIESARAVIFLSSRTSERSERDPGPITTNVRLRPNWTAVVSPTGIDGYASLLSQERQRLSSPATADDPVFQRR